MSLTSFLTNKDVKERFRQEFSKPRFAAESELLAPPLTDHYALVGTAFDYLLRFYVQRLNPSAIATKWIAEYAITHPLSPLLTNVVVDANTGAISYAETEQTQRVRGMIERAKRVHSGYLSSGNMSDELMESSVLLAQLDPIFRAGVVDANIGVVPEQDIVDLRNLISIVEPEIFRARELCLLNPGFGKGSRLVGGADADLVIDDTLIDIKTTKTLKLQRRDFDQLIGYYVLHEIAGVGEVQPKPQIERVAIYFSRHAYLYVLELAEIIDRHAFSDFVRWFTERARRQYRVTGL